MRHFRSKVSHFVARRSPRRGLGSSDRVGLWYQVQVPCPWSLDAPSERRLFAGFPPVGRVFLLGFGGFVVGVGCAAFVTIVERRFRRLPVAHHLRKLHRENSADDLVQRGVVIAEVVFFVLVFDENLQ